MATRESYSKLELMQARVKEIPRGWNFSDVGRVFSIKNNLRRPISEAEREKTPGVYPYYGPTKIQGFIGTYEQDGSYALIGEDGDHFLKYRTQKMTQLVDGKCTVNNHAHIIQESKVATREWFYYYFMHRDIFSFLSRQGAGRFKLNKASLEKIPLLVPPVVEQKKIVQILSTWDKAITTTEQLLANSQQQKKALMQQLLTGKKRLLDENGVRFRREWKSLELEQFARVYQPKTISQSELTEEGFPVYGANGLIGFYSDFNHANEQIAVTCRGSTCGLVNWTKEKSWITGNAMVVNVDKSPIVIKKFIYYSLKASNLAYLVTGSGQPQITGELKRHKIKLPPINEQLSIAIVLWAADKELKLLETRLSALKTEKKALMQQLLTGKRRVKVDEDAA